VPPVSGGFRFDRLLWTLKDDSLAKGRKSPVSVIPV